MLAILIILTSTFLQEAASSIGKISVRKKRETVYSLAFLGVFWSLIFLIGAVLFFNVEFHIELASLFTLIPRIGLEILLAFLGAEAIVKADRSTVGFLRLLTVPLLLFVDITLGYQLTAWQILGVIIMFVGLLLAFHRSPKSKKGAGYAVLCAVISVATISLYKWDISHYNSVAGEQIVVLTSMVVVFYIAAALRSKSNPLRLLVQPVTGTQSLASGLSGAIEGFAYAFAPASVILAFKRCAALLWTIGFGHTYFHETSLVQKLHAGAWMSAGLFLLATPYLTLH